MTNVDEVMVTANIYDHEARLKSFGIAADLFNELGAEKAEQDCA